MYPALFWKGSPPLIGPGHPDSCKRAFSSPMPAASLSPAPMAGLSTHPMPATMLGTVKSKRSAAELHLFRSWSLDSYILDILGTESKIWTSWTDKPQAAIEPALLSRARQWPIHLSWESNVWDPGSDGYNQPWFKGVMVPLWDPWRPFKSPDVKTYLPICFFTILAHADRVSITLPVVFSEDAQFYIQEAY